VLTLRRAVALAAAAWVARWLALELASFAGHKLLRPRRLPLDSPRPPGWMPGPFDRPARPARPWPRD
jgi:hypothetical protein